MQANGAPITMINSILAGNTPHGSSSPSDCQVGGTGAFVDDGHNLVGDADGCSGLGSGSGSGSGTGTQAGTGAAPLAADLAALAYNGVPTPTQALTQGSPAIGGGDPVQCQADPVDNLDQRGSSRNADTRGTCDIGAYDTGGN